MAQRVRARRPTREFNQTSELAIEQRTALLKELFGTTDESTFPIRIGDNTTIAAGSVVTKGIPANVLAGGNRVDRHPGAHAERKM